MAQKTSAPPQETILSLIRFFEEHRRVSHIDDAPTNCTPWTKGVISSITNIYNHHYHVVNDDDNNDADHDDDDDCVNMTSVITMTLILMLMLMPMMHLMGQSWRSSKWMRRCLGRTRVSKFGGSHTF